jgi:hypothetical protein
MDRCNTESSERDRGSKLVLHFAKGNNRAQHYVVTLQGEVSLEGYVRFVKFWSKYQ